MASYLGSQVAILYGTFSTSGIDPLTVNNVFFFVFENVPV